LPDLVAELTAERIAAGRLDLGDFGAVVTEQHRGHRTGNAPAQVQHLQILQNSCHRRTLVLLQIRD